MVDKKYLVEELEDRGNEILKDTQRSLLRTLVDNIYDIQSARIAVGNRLVAGLRSMGLVDSENEDVPKDEKETKNRKLLDTFIAEYEKVSEVYVNMFGSKGSIKKAIEELKIQNTYIVTELAYNMVTSFINVLQSEVSMGKLLTKEVQKHLMWDDFFKDVKGCGPLMAAVCIAYFNPYKARYASNFGLMLV